MGLSDTEITLVVVASCGGVLLAVFTACLIVYCCFRKGKERKRLRETSFKSRTGIREGGAKFFDYERRVFKQPPPYTEGESTSFQSDLDNRSYVSDKIYSTHYEQRNLPIPTVNYGRMYGERNFEFYPPLEGRFKEDRPSFSLKENTIYIPYSPTFSESFLSEKVYPESFYPRLSVKELDDNVSTNEEWKYKSINRKSRLPRYELEYL